MTDTISSGTVFGGLGAFGLRDEAKVSACRWTYSTVPIAGAEDPRIAEAASGW